MSEFVENLKRDPQSFADAHYNEGFALRGEERDAIQLAGLQKRFRELAPKLPALAKLAADQGIHEINTLDDAAPLLFPHTVYKSYPLSFIEKCQFDKLTKWLSRLTTVDVSGVDTQGVETIDEWIARVEAATDINLVHTFGTTGKLSFLPRTKTQSRLSARLNAHTIRDFNGYNSGPDVLAHNLPLISPSYRHGASAIGNQQVAPGLGADTLESLRRGHHRRYHQQQRAVPWTKSLWYAGHKPRPRAVRDNEFQDCVGTRRRPLRSYWH